MIEELKQLGDETQALIDDLVAEMGKVDEVVAKVAQLESNILSSDSEFQSQQDVIEAEINAIIGQ